MKKILINAIIFFLVLFPIVANANTTSAYDHSSAPYVHTYPLVCQKIGKTLNPAPILLQKCAKNRSVLAANRSSANILDDATIELQLFQEERYTNGTSLSDAVLVIFSENGDNSVQFNDAIKLFNIDENLGIVNGDHILSIANRAFPTNGETLPLWCGGYQVNSYVFLPLMNNFPEGTTAYLYDNYLGTQTELMNETPFYFNINTAIPASVATDRFSFVFEVRPVNDDLVNAIPLPMNIDCSGDTYTNVGATKENGEPEPACFYFLNNSVWFSFNAPASGSVVISSDILPGEITDSQIAVYPAPTDLNDPTTLPPALDCDQDSGELVGLGYMSVLVLDNLISGATYYIQVDGYALSTGNFCIEVQNADYVYSKDHHWLPTNPNGVSTSADDILVLNGEATFTNDIALKNLTVENGAILNVEAVLATSGNIINNGKIVFVNNATDLGQLANMAGSTIAGNGEITVQRYIPSRDDGKGAWRYLTSAVISSESMHANWQERANMNGNGNNPNPGYGMFITGSTDGSNGFDATPSGDPSMFSYDNSNNPSQEYTAVSNTDVDLLMAGHPYSAYVWGDRSVDILGTNDPIATTTTLRATGSLVTGEHSLNNLSESAGSFNLIGNPYQAIVDMGDVMTASSNLNPAYYYVWDPNLSLRGAYTTVSLPSGESTPSPSDANQYLMPGQAVWVVTATNGPTTLSFQESAKNVTVDPTDVFREESNMAHIELQLFQAERFANGKTLSDALRINFSENGNNAVLPNDATKLPNMDENIGRMNGDELLSIEYRALPTDGETLLLYIDQYRVSDYVYRATMTGLPEGTTAYLLDNYLNIQIELTNNQTTLIEFGVDETVPESIAPDRFSISFSTDPLSINDNLATSKFSIYPNPVKNEEFFITAPGLSGEEVQISLYNILGQRILVLTKSINSSERISISAALLQPGMYMIEMCYKEKTATGKLIVE